MNCPHCKTTIPNSLIISESSRILGKKKSPVKSKKSAENGKLGGRPKKTK